VNGQSFISAHAWFDAGRRALWITKSHDCHVMPRLPGGSFVCLRLGILLQNSNIS